MSDERLTELVDVLYNPDLDCYYPNICHELIVAVKRLKAENKELKNLNKEFEKQTLTNQMCILASLGTIGNDKLCSAQQDNIQARIKESMNLRDRCEDEEK